MIDILNIIKDEQNIIRFLGFAFVFKVSFWLIDTLKTRKKESQLMKLALEYRKNRDQQLNNLKIEKPDLSADLIEQILSASISELKNMLEQNKITSVKLLNLYMTRIKDIGLKLELITDINYQNALKDAQRCDQIRKTNPEQCQGELFGIPISIKDTFDLQGLPSTIGLASRLNPIAEDGLQAKILKKAGAIIMVKSNVPQIAFTFQSENFIFGKSKNPYDQKRTPGGSSGGEAGLVAARCAPFGLGSDVGGSIRIPSAYCGVVGFKPCSQRLDCNGHTYYCDTMDGMPGIRCSIGPIAKSVEDCALIMKTLLNQKYNAQLNDPYFLLSPFDNQMYAETKKFKLGYIKSFDIFTATQANQRAVQIAIDVLRKKGHEVVEIKIPFIEQVMNDFGKFIYGDNGEAINQMLKGEKMIDVYGLSQFLCTHPTITRTLCFFIRMIGNKQLSSTISNFLPLTAAEDRRVYGSIMKLRKEMMKLWNNAGIDALIAPGIPPAHKFHLTDKVAVHMIYAYIWNVFNLPAGVIPVTSILENEQHYENSADKKDVSQSFMNENLSDSAGLPVSVQVVGLPYQEERCLNIMKQIEDAVQFKQKKF